MKQIRGVVPVLPIPFHKDESIDEASLRKVVEYVVSLNLPAMCLPAYGSEFQKLSDIERKRVVEIAIETSAGQVPVVAQANHVSSRIASQIARDYQEIGADVISFALPRQFAVNEQDLLDYSATICDAVDIPVLIQDFNPGGTTIDANFIATLANRCDNFRYVKLEEPMIVNKIKRIRDHVGERVGILEGWGGYYMLEAVPVGCIGIMPGVPIAGPLQEVFDLVYNGKTIEAMVLFARLLPFINYTLQNFELFLQVEKRLLVRMGIIESPICRMLTYRPTPTELEYIDILVEHMSNLACLKA